MAEHGVRTEDKDLIEWSIVEGDAKRFELHLANLSEYEMAVFTQVVAACQRRREQEQLRAAAENQLGDHGALYGDEPR